MHKGNEMQILWHIIYLKHLKKEIENKNCNNMFYCIHTCRNDARTKAKNPGALTTTKPTKIPIGLKLHRIPK